MQKSLVCPVPDESHENVIAGTRGSIGPSASAWRPWRNGACEKRAAFEGLMDKTKRVRRIGLMYVSSGSKAVVSWPEWHVGSSFDSGHHMVPRGSSRFQRSQNVLTSTAAAPATRAGGIPTDKRSTRVSNAFGCTTRQRAVSAAHPRRRPGWSGRRCPSSALRGLVIGASL
jgi:hypothetical protein